MSTPDLTSISSSSAAPDTATAGAALPNWRVRDQIGTLLKVAGLAATVAGIVLLATMPPAIGVALIIGGGLIVFGGSYLQRTAVELRAKYGKAGSFGPQLPTLSEEEKTEWIARYESNCKKSLGFSITAVITTAASPALAFGLPLVITSPYLMPALVAITLAIDFFSLHYSNVCHYQRTVLEANGVVFG